MNAIRNAALLAALVLLGAGPARAEAPPDHRQVHLNVVATAYNSTHTQTDGDPHIGAWGDRLDLVKDARVIAVSRDLLKKGLTRGRRVKIHGYAGEFVVLDKMPKRWKNHIDIFMNKDIRAARRFGRKRVKISWVEAEAKKDGAAPAQPRPADRQQPRT